MNDRQKPHPVRFLFKWLKKSFLFACFLLVGFAGAAYAAGWIDLHHDPDQQTATIELDTGDVRETTKEAMDLGRQFLDGLAEEAGGEGENGRQFVEQLVRKEGTPAMETPEATDYATRMGASAAIPERR